MRRYISTKAICPNYKHENKSVVFCKGICENSVNHLAFANPHDCHEFKKKYCKQDYSKCPIKKMSEENNAIQ